MADEDFSPETHRFAEPRYFDDFRVGERFYIPSRTMTDALFAAFQLASGDNHPIPYDRPYCRARGHRDLHNQDKELVMDGEHRYLLRRKP